MATPEKLSDTEINARRNYSTTESISRSIDSGYYTLDVFPKLINAAIEQRVWENIFCVPTKQYVSFQSMREWITSYKPEGLHTTPQKIEALIKDDPDLLAKFRAELAAELKTHGGDRKTKQNQGDNDNLDKDRGTLF